MFCRRSGTKALRAMAAMMAITVLVGWQGDKREKKEERNGENEEEALQRQFARARGMIRRKEPLSHPEAIAEVVRLATPAAQNGNVDAQVLLGECYEFMRWPFNQGGLGQSVPRRSLMDAEGNYFGFGYQQVEGMKWYDEPAKWFLRAAKSEDPRAQSRMVRYYHIGLGVPKNIDEADYWDSKGGDLVEPLQTADGHEPRITITNRQLEALSTRAWKNWTGFVEWEEPPEELEEPPPPAVEPPPEDMVDVTLDTPTAAPVAPTDASAPVSNEPQSFKPAPVNSALLINSPVKLPGIQGVARDAGSIGQRTSGGAVYGDATTERAVLMALRWLKETQEPNGSWGAKPELGLTRGMDKAAGAGFAVLTFLAHGETPDSKEFGPTVEKALNYLIKSVYVAKGKDPNGNTPYIRMSGAIGSEYGFLIGTYALCEAYAMTKNPNARIAAEKTLRRIIDGQTPTGGWNYNMARTTKDGPDDISFGGWAIQALKAAKMAGIHLDGMEECIKKSVRCLQTRNYSEKAGFVYRATTNHKGGGGGLAGVGCLAMQLLGYANDPKVVNALNVMNDWEPSLDKEYSYVKSGTRHNPQYYCYYATQCKYQAGMAKNATPANLALWKKWNKEMKDLYPKAIVKVLKKDGSPYTVKDARGIDREIGHWVNCDHYNYDVMGTCLAALQLMVYYRYLPTSGLKATEVKADLESLIKDKAGEVDVSIDL